jgi:ABC-type glutathione transport system ATPase component
METMPILDLANVVRTYPGRRGGQPVTAVSGVSVQVFPGEIVAIVGESGSGKSTLARLALGLEKPDSGAVLHDSVRIDSLRGKALRDSRIRVQPVFQNHSASFNPRRRIAEILLQASRFPDGVPHSAPEYEKYAVGLLESVGLRPGADFLGRYAHELSGGQMQRLAMARALGMRPKLIVADEPLSGADVSIRGQILNLLENVRRETHVGLLLISHDVSTVRAVADRVIVMYKGSIIEQGDPMEVLVSPKEEYTRRLIAAVPEIVGTAVEQPLNF